ncbi:uncharacterized protein A1O9_04399 [Exophiala aquamarina CBS 119918]|uniref:Putative peptidase domain-containing protein n=1 Tax=Exophiala aquamarina CBS 119918 TaxID=1182545 RepID=A0A072PVF0_9EURO|nr:uncharacterized protein A1O9_04399 [Exophiala aquamarina CBS 119918]KEF59555.1 hypothetical protein A1O9_04399 [Exophiala aquamarina CBS 119918]
MTVLLKALLLSAVTGVLAAPTRLETRQDSNPTVKSWDAGAVTQYPIHESCNATQAHQIALGLNETVILAQHAKEHVLRFSNNSEIYRRYFGDRPPYEVIGAYDIIVNGDKGDVLFRCDNPDGNCDLPGWGGHWRGSNATQETVICDLSYETRRSLSQMCALGYNVAESPSNTFWASDLMHRLYHMPSIGWEYIEHFADDYDEVVELAAANNSTESTHDSDTLQYFALEAYAYDIAVPGVGCSGAEGSHSHAPASSSAAPSAPAATATTSGSPTQPQAPSSTVSIPPVSGHDLSFSANTDAFQGCHTHEGGDLHCTSSTSTSG